MTRKLALTVAWMLVAAMPLTALLATADDLGGTVCEFGTVEPCTRNQIDPQDKPWPLPWIIPIDSPDYFLDVAPAPAGTAKLYVLVNYRANATLGYAWNQDVYTRVMAPGESFESEVPLRNGRPATVTHCYYTAANVPLWCSTGPEVMVTLSGDAHDALDGQVGMPDLQSVSSEFGNKLFKAPEDPDYNECLDPNPPIDCGP